MRIAKQWFRSKMPPQVPDLNASSAAGSALLKALELLGGGATLVDLDHQEGRIRRL